MVARKIHDMKMTGPNCNETARRVYTTWNCRSTLYVMKIWNV